MIHKGWRVVKQKLIQKLKKKKKKSYEPMTCYLSLMNSMGGRMVNPPAKTFIGLLCHDWLLAGRVLPSLKQVWG